MSLDTLIIYGSGARDDQDAHSDVDLLGITSMQDYNMIVKKKVNIAIYPVAQAFRMAKHGDLFMLHIVSEGQAIYDGKGYFSELQSIFSFKPSYDLDICNASDLGWVLLRYARVAENVTLINKRIAWCVRTILIAKAAEERLPIFSAKALSDFSKSRAVYALIKNKNNEKIILSMLSDFNKFLTSFGRVAPAWINSNDSNVYLSEFRRSNNFVGEHTLKSLLSGTGDFGY